MCNSLVRETATAAYSLMLKQNNFIQMRHQVEQKVLKYDDSRRT